MQNRAADVLQVSVRGWVRGFDSFFEKPKVVRVIINETS